MEISNEEFVELWKKLGSPKLVGAHLKIGQTAVFRRRDRIEANLGVKLPSWNDLSSRRMTIKKSEGRIDLTVKDGCILVFSDAHFWPEVRTTAFRGLLALIKQVKPVAIVCNGDAFDGATVSRWPNTSWMDKKRKPSVIDELNAVKDRLGEIEEIAKCDLIWPLGNHDARYETKLAAVAPEYEGVSGFTLKEHFPAWKPCWTVWVNDDSLICHFWHTGIHDTHNNLLKGQCHQITGHTHSLKWTPWTTSSGRTIYGVNTGTLANSLDEHNIDYMHGLHGNHRSGFALLTWREGQLLMPELASVWDEDHIEFRGHILNADTGAIVP